MATELTPELQARAKKGGIFQDCLNIEEDEEAGYIGCGLYLVATIGSKIVGMKWMGDRLPRGTTRAFREKHPGAQIWRATGSCYSLMEWELLTNKPV